MQVCSIGASLQQSSLYLLPCALRFGPEIDVRQHLSKTCCISAVCSEPQDLLHPQTSALYHRGSIDSAVEEPCDNILHPVWSYKAR